VPLIVDIINRELERTVPFAGVGDVGALGPRSAMFDPRVTRRSRRSSRTAALPAV
jgi:hypothetical protein